MITRSGTEPVISAAAAVDIATRLKDHNIDAEAFFQSLNIDARATHDPYQMISLVRFTDLLEAAAERLDYPSLGLMLGMNQDPAKWGAYGYVLLNSPTVSAAFDNVVDYLTAWQTGTHIVCKEINDEFGIEYSILHPSVTKKDQDAEFSIGFAKNLIDRLAKQSATPTAVYFEHEPLTDITTYERVFSVMPQFSQPYNAIYYPLAVRDYNVPFADVRLYPIIKRHLSDLAVNQPDCGDLIANVEYCIKQSLHNQDCSLQTLAATLSMKPRTLQRQLSAKGTSFGESLNKVRREQATQLLKETPLSVNEISHLLGYCDASAFVKAFRKWENATPTEYREREKPRLPA